MRNTEMCKVHRCSANVGQASAFTNKVAEVPSCDFHSQGDPPSFRDLAFPTPNLIVVCRYFLPANTSNTTYSLQR